MDFQIWAASRLGRVDLTIRRDIVFYAPLVESLDFYGIEPVTFTYASGNVRIGRDGLLHTIQPNVPRFDFSGEIPLGILMTAGTLLQFSAANGLENANTLVWFENNLPMSTPSDSNPMSSSGMYAGHPDVYIKHLTKANRILTATEILVLQRALSEIPIVAPEPPPIEVAIDVGQFVTETPAGTRNGTNVTFTLSQNPVIDTVRLACFGVICQRVAATPGNMEYTLSGTGNKTVTMGMGPNATGYPFFATYNTATPQLGFLRKETPAGARNGSNTVFTLSRVPVAQSLFVVCFGSPIQQVASAPQQMEYTLSGTILTLGMAPTTGTPFVAHYLSTT